MPRTLRLKIMVGVLVFASCVGLAALASQKHGVTAVNDSINFDQTQCSGGWGDEVGQTYLKGHVDGHYRGMRFPRTSRGITAAKRACEGTDSCSGITCKGRACELRKGLPHRSPYSSESSMVCKGTAAAVPEQGQSSVTDQGPSCPGGWYQYGIRFGSGFFHLGDFASGPDGKGKELKRLAAEEACLLDPTCSGITCRGVGCTLRSGRPDVSIEMERSYLCRDRR